jgi:uncharacterized membrane protein YgcG
MKAFVLGSVLVLAAIPSAAQTAVAPWEPFLGCWELTFENLTEGAAAARAASRPLASRPKNAGGPRVCVTRTTDGARFETTVDGQPAIDQTLVADAADHPINDAECRGTQRAEFSRDGLRLFSRAELTCAGDPVPRRVSGISLLAPNGQWMDIQAIERAGRETVRVRRYYQADGQLPRTRPTFALSRLTIDDVQEASGKVVPRALEAALVETGAGFDLTSKQLLALDDAGVPDSVVDLMVALSYPDRFVVERTPRGGGGAGTSFAGDPFMLGWAFGYPVLYDDFFYSPYYYRPFGYANYGYGYYGSIGGDVVVVPVEPGPQPSGTGRVVDGQGYTRIRPRETAAADDRPNTSRTSSLPSGDSGGSSSGSSSGTASSSGGYSSGGSGGGGGDTGRTAVPR